MPEQAAVLEVRNLKKHFPIRKGLLQRARNLPAESLQALGKALAASGPQIIGNAVKFRFTNQRGPFPVSQNKLGFVSRQLRASLYATKPQINPGANEVTIGFGSPIKYFAIHEFGGTIQRKARTQVNHFRFLEDGRRARFSKVKGATHAQKNTIGAYTIKIPARRPMFTELSQPRSEKIVLENARRTLTAMLTEMEGGKTA